MICLRLVEPTDRRAAITFKGIPDKRNDQRKGSHLWENRRNFDKKLLGEVRTLKSANHNILKILCLNFMH